MRARIAIAFVAILSAALILAGGVSLLLVRHAASVDAQRTVLRQANALVTALKNPTTEPLIQDHQPLFNLIQSLAGLPHEDDLVVANGHLQGKPPPGIIVTAAQAETLAHGHSFSASHNHIAYAAVPLFSVRSTTVALVFQSPESFSSDSVWYFLFASGLSLLAAAAIASIISGRIARRVVAVSKAAERIAGGDFGTRLPDSGANYPELLALDRAINTMTEDLERAREAERDFLLSISHDLRTPLTSIRGYAEAISDGAALDPAHAASVVVAEAARLERLIGDLLDLARLRARRFPLDLVDVDLSRCVRDAAEAMRYAFEVAGVTLALHVDDAVRSAGDPHRIGQIMANLTENALKFAESDVEISLVATPVGAVLSVTDDGPGIDPEDLPHVFERLFTSRRFAARAAGTGIGLAIVAELSSAMGGDIDVASPLGPTGGTRISVSLPRLEGSDVAPDPERVLEH